MAETENDSQQENEIVKEENGQAEVKADDKPAEETTEQQPDKPKEEPSAELIEKIKKQIEFYFGDVNMQRDKFLIEQTKLDEGWVPMSVMLNFKLLASMSKDIDVILKALEESELIEISEDRKKIRRALDKPLPAYNDEYRKAQEARTVYLKGFPLDSSIETLKNHFESVDFENIILRKYKKGKEHFFKGSIFLQFKTLDDAKAFMEQESRKYKDTELIKMWSKDYLAMKEKEKEDLRIKKLHKQLDNDAKATKKNKTQNKIELPKGCVLHISNLEKIDREAVKLKFTELETEVSFVDFKAGDAEGFIRLQGENSAVEFLKKLESSKVKVGESEIECKLVEGEEEEAYLSKVVENMTNVRRSKGFHGKRRNNKRRSSPHRDGNHKKARSSDD